MNSDIDQKVFAFAKDASPSFESFWTAPPQPTGNIHFGMDSSRFSLSFKACHGNLSQSRYGKFFEIIDCENWFANTNTYQFSLL